MKIGIIGAGNVGGNLGQVWSKLGHDVMYGVRDPEAEKVQSLLARSGEHSWARNIAETVQFGQVITIATPWSALEKVVQSTASWQGKIVIDTTNRFGNDVETGSIAQHLAALIPGASVVKAFNTIGAEHYGAPQFGDQTASMFLCGDDDSAKGVVSELAAQMGFDPVDVGPLSSAGMLEALARLWVSMAYGKGGRDIAFKLIRR